MKAFLISLIAVVFAGSAFAQTFTAPAVRPGPTPKPPPPISQRDVQGVIPRAIRGGNPLQMLNPKAPAKYGTAAQSVILDPDTGKWRGIKLFEIFF